MKKSVILLLVVAFSGSACTGYVAGTAAPAPGYYGPGPAVGVVVAEDRPYYTHGAYYVSRGSSYRWVGGHYVYRRGQRIWIHGHYVSR